MRDGGAGWVAIAAGSRAADGAGGDGAESRVVAGRVTDGGVSAAVDFGTGAAVPGAGCGAREPQRAGRDGPRLTATGAGRWLCRGASYRDAANRDQACGGLAAAVCRGGEWVRFGAREDAGRVLR